MKTFFIVALALFAICSSQTCSSTTYGNVGDICSTGQNSTKSCKQFTSCIDGRCKLSHIGSSCAQDADCFLNRRTQGDVACIDKVCTKKKYNGEWCRVNDECYGGKCDRGCQGAKLDEACDPSQSVQCEKGLYCSLRTSKCRAQRKIGETCDDYVREGPGRNFNIICPGGTICQTIQNSDKRCRKFGYVMEGGDCTFDNECVGFMRCSSKGVCTVPTWGWGTCLGAPRNCTTFEGESCICGTNGAGPTCQKTSGGRSDCDYDTMMKNIRDCQERANCPYDRNYQFFSNYFNAFPQAGTCMSDNCGSIIRQYLCCLGDGFDNNPYSWGHSAPLSCGANPVVTALVVLLFVFAGFSVVVTAIVIVIVILKRKREDGFQKF